MFAKAVVGELELEGWPKSQPNMWERWGWWIEGAFVGAHFVCSLWNEKILIV